MCRQLEEFGDFNYCYNENGIRTVKNIGETTTAYLLDGTKIIEQRTEGADFENSVYFYYDSSDEVIGFKYNGNNYFYVKNAMSDVIAIADKDGNVVSEYSYDPWGKVLSVTGSNLEVANINPFRYRSYYYDNETGMYYLQSRYYDPEICRFINCDDVNYIGVTESEISYNPFAYCGNEPVNDSDPMGTFSVSSVKDSIVKLLSKLKTGFFDYIKSLIKNEKGCISISTDLIALVINTALKIVLTKYLVSSTRRYNQTTMIPKANLNKLITLNYFINGDIPRLTNIFNFAFGRRFSGELAFFSGKAPD